MINIKSQELRAWMVAQGEILNAPSPLPEEWMLSRTAPPGVVRDYILRLHANPLPIPLFVEIIKEIERWARHNPTSRVGGFLAEYRLELPYVLEEVPYPQEPFEIAPTVQPSSYVGQTLHRLTAEARDARMSAATGVVFI